MSKWLTVLTASPKLLRISRMTVDAGPTDRLITTGNKVFFGSISNTRYKTFVYVFPTDAFKCVPAYYCFVEQTKFYRFPLAVFDSEPGPRHFVLVFSIFQAQTILEKIVPIDK